MTASTINAIARRYMGVSETRNVAVDFSRKLDSGETLTGTPTVTEGTGGLTLSDKAVNTSTLVINGDTVTAGYAVQFKVVAASTGTYTITVLCGTTSTPAQTLEARLTLVVV